MTELVVSGNIVDLHNRRIYKGTVQVKNATINRIQADNTVDNEQYIMPGFIDAHIHIESSMLLPSEFARLAVTSGTVAAVADPHEIANVMGIEGVKYFIENGKKVPFKFYFGAPSCVPATAFETAGATLGLTELETLLADPDIKFLSEMMNWPGVLQDEPFVKNELALARKYHKVIDGHAPGLRGKEAEKYIGVGISTDHECFTLAEAMEKAALGMKILIREGSAVHNFDDLIPMIKQYPEKVMFCSDDKHPDELVKGHINLLVRRAIASGYDLYDVLRAACLTPVEHYGLDIGLLQEGDRADFIIVKDLEKFELLATYIEGKLLSEKNKSLVPHLVPAPINKFNTKIKEPADFAVYSENEKIPVIEVIDQQLVTNKVMLKIPKTQNNLLLTDPEHDLLKITVINRYENTKPAVAFIKNFGLKEGAIASSVAHDSHNIIAVGVDDDLICQAVNLIIEHQGGIVALNAQKQKILPLPIAGIISPENGYQVAHTYAELDKMAKSMGSALHAPFMTISFMALLVIPSLKISDKGLFDSQNFEFISF